MRIEGDNAYVIMLGKIKQLKLRKISDFIGKSYWGSGHAPLIKDFYDSIKEGRSFSIDAYEGGKAVKEFLAIYTSSESGEKIFLK